MIQLLNNLWWCSWCVGGGCWSSCLEIVCVSIIRNGEKSCECFIVFLLLKACRMYQNFFLGEGLFYLFFFAYSFVVLRR